MKMLKAVSEDKNLRSPHVARVLDLVEDGVCYYVIMEFVRGRDLFDYFVQDKVYEKPYKLQIVTQI